jgi:uncharacterized protein (UPF0332 family)
MNTNYLADLLKYRIQQSHETLEEAKILFEKRALRGAVNRAYYAMFYALLALLATRGLGTSKHSGAISLFDKEFVKKGTFPKEMSKSLRIAFDRRQTWDYGEMIEVDEKVVQEAIDNARFFVSEIEKHLIGSAFLPQNP